MNAEIERIFAHAVALNQSGRLKNTIYCSQKVVFILNAESTVLLRFILPKHASGFSQAISFKADDYDSSKFYEKDGAVVFVKEGEEFTRKKTCGTPELSFQEVQALWEKLNQPFEIESKGTENRFVINKVSLELIEENLSHLEFSGRNGSLIIQQRDIFSGSVITLTRKSTGLGVVQPDNIPNDFEPIGIRTSDFIALYSFQNIMTFHMRRSTPAYLKVWGLKNLTTLGNMEGIIAHCLYDELGSVKYLQEIDHGRGQVSQDRGSEQIVDRQAGSGPKPIRIAMPKEN